MQTVQPPRKKKVKIIWRGFIIRLVILFTLAVLSVAGYYGYKLYSFSQKISQPAANQTTDQPLPTTIENLLQGAKNMLSDEKPPLKGQDQGRINVLLLGMGGEGHKGQYLTDTIMLASFNPTTYQSALLSIPRDLYVDVPELDVSTKINAVYAYGMMSTEENSPQSMEYLKEVVQEVTGQPVHYYLILNFDGFQHIIGELGGIDVDVPQDIYDDRYPGPNFSYQTFEINKGFHHLDGETALKYARVRHTAGGDFGRASRQQQILAATKRKALSLGTILNPHRLGNFIDALGDNMKTDVQLPEIPSFIDIANNVNIYQTTNKVLDAWNPDSLLASTHKPLGGTMAYVLMPRAKNYSQIHELADNIFDLEMIQRQKKSIEEEGATVGIIVTPNENRTKVKTAFQRLGYPITSIQRSSSQLNQHQEPDTSNEKQPLPTCNEKNIIFNNSDKPKLFTLDDLANKFEAQVRDEKIDGFDEDVVVCLTEDAIDYFNQQNEKAEDEDQQLREQSVLDSQGDIRVNKDERKKKKK